MKKQNHCQDCGKKIHVQAITCEPCYYLRKKESQKGINNSNFKTGDYIKQHYCQCGKKISLNNYLYGKKRCLKCYLNSIKGTNHPNYIDGSSYELYPIEFTDELKESIRKRDNYECQNCSITEEEHLIVVGTILNVHHIDYNKQNCNENNLITLCKQCNLRANFNRDYWIKFYSNKLIRTS